MKNSLINRIFDIWNSFPYDFGDINDLNVLKNFIDKFFADSDLEWCCASVGVAGVEIVSLKGAGGALSWISCVRVLSTGMSPPVSLIGLRFEEVFKVVVNYFLLI